MQSKEPSHWATQPIDSESRPRPGERESTMTNPDRTRHNRVVGTACILLVSGVLVGGSLAVGANAQEQTAPTSSRLPDKTPAFLKEMPEPERVIADIRGPDALNTAARQVAALNRLVDVVIVLSGTADAPGGPRLTTEEQNLNGRYAGAASSLLTTVYRSIDPDNKQQSDENSKRNQWNRLRDRYGADDAFVSALLERYLTPDLTKTYLGHMRQTRQHVQALNQHIQGAQARQNAQAAAEHQHKVSIRQTDLPGFSSLVSAAVLLGIGIGVLVLEVWWWRRDNDGGVQPEKCGYDGTKINPGYNECPSCHAVYRKQAGCIGNLFGFLGMGIVGFVALPIMMFMHGGWLLGLLVAEAGAGVVLVAYKLAPYRWVKPTTTVYVR
jgi:hypothetical protein